MKRRFWKQSLSLALTFAFILAMPCVTSVWAGGSVEYLVGTWSEEENKVTWTTESKAESDYTEITSDNPPVQWGSDDNNEHWYVVTGTVTIGSRVTVTGDVHLILKDNCNLIVNGGIQVAERNSLTIYAQSKDDDGLPTASTGRLTAQNVAAHNAGIGGNDGETGGAITISGGTITASSNRVGDASIRSDTITISGGTVNASASGYHGVAINGSKISISGGTVKASTYAYGGVAISGGTITISGGTVNANSTGASSIAIQVTEGSTLTISGGTVKASSDGSGGVAINGSEISISGGTVTASSTGDLGIAIKVTQGSTLTISGGTVKASSKARTIGNSKNGCGDIIISGGTVEAGSIGFIPVDTYTNQITISGGTVRTTNSIIGDFSTGESGNAVIYAGQIYCNDKGNSQNSWSGIIFEKNAGTVYGNQTLRDDMTLSGNQTLTVPQSLTLTIPNGKSLTVNQGCKLTINGSLTNNGTLMIYEASCLGGEGTLDGSGEFRIATPFPELKNSTLTYNGRDLAGSLKLVSTADETEKTILSQEFTVIEADKWQTTDPIIDVGEHTVTFSYAGFTVSFSVTVKPKPEPSLGYRLPDAFSQPFGCESDTLGLVDVNGAYQFRFTSEFGTPPVVELDSESFRAELASQEGNDYFWKVYALGSSGETCNVTVNGTCVARLTAVSAAPASGLVVSDTTAPFTVAAGGSYQFRLTADAMPSMAAGSPCFTVEYVGNDGKDWFFKVYAIGNVGDACGFYVNRAPTPVAVATIA